MSPWIEAMRLRTLPVSIAGVFAGWLVALAYDSFSWLPAMICLVFAVAAQIVSNFANEYFDFRNGLDRKGRQGFRRGVTEGDITPSAMKRAMIWLMAADCALGCTLIYWGGWWLLPIGIMIAMFAFAYSAGPWPLSHHGLGDLTVILFYGVVPVTLTAYVQCGGWTGGEAAVALGDMWRMALPLSVAIGLLADNVLIVNNVRDADDDRIVDKHTTAVIFGPKSMKCVYVIFAYSGLFLMWWSLRDALQPWSWAGYLSVGIWYLPIEWALFRYKGARLNLVLKDTSLMILAAVLWGFVCL